MVLDLGSLQNSHEGRISCLGLSADGSALCTGSWDTNLKVSMHFGLILKLAGYDSFFGGGGLASMLVDIFLVFLSH